MSLAKTKGESILSALANRAINRREGGTLEGGPLVKRRLLENWGRLLGHSSFRQLSVGRRDRTGRILSLARAPSRSSIRVIAFPPLPFNVGKWAPCHACSPLLDPSPRDPLPLPLLSFLQESLRDSRTTFIQFGSTGAGRKIATYLRH